MKARWLIKIRRQKFKPSKWSCLCSLHFEEDSFVPNKKRRILKKQAVPSIFPSFPKHLQKKAKARKPPKDRSKTNYPTNLADQRVVDLDHSYDFPNKNDLKRSLEISNNKNDALTKKVRNLNYANKCLKKEVTSMKEVVNELKEKHIVSEDIVEVLEHAGSKVPAQVFQRLAEMRGKSAHAQKL